MKIKKLKKAWSLALAGVMALTLGLFSADLPAQAGTNGTVNNPAQAVVTKNLQYADGITTPNVTFDFNFTPVSYNENESDVGYVPAISDKSITYSGSEARPSDGNFIKETEDVLVGLSWPAAGLYTYTVKESVGTTTDIDNGTMKYSLAEYTLYVVVAYDEDSDQLYVFETKCQKTKDDDGNDVTDDKDDPAPGEYGLQFINVFTKEGGIEETASSIVIKKTVSGSYGNQSVENKFSFTLNVTFPFTATNGDTYKDTTDTYELVVGGNTTVSFELSHNQTLVFEDMPAGTTYTLSESGTNKYTPSYSVVQNGETPISDTGTESLGFSTPSNMLIGENANTATFDNRNDNEIETGILVSNLPYILLIAAAMLGLVAFVVVKRRRDMR